MNMTGTSTTARGLDYAVIDAQAAIAKEVDDLRPFLDDERPHVREAARRFLYDVDRLYGEMLNIRVGEMRIRDAVRASERT